LYTHQRLLKYHNCINGGLGGLFLGGAFDLVSNIKRYIKMDKKSVERGMTKEEVKNHLAKFTHNRQKDKYLDRILAKKKLLDPKTREAIYDCIADEVKEEWKSDPFPPNYRIEKLIKKVGEERRPELYERIATKAAKKGYFYWAESLMAEAGFESKKVYESMIEYCTKESKFAREMAERPYNRAENRHAHTLASRRWDDEAEFQEKQIIRVRKRISGLEGTVIVAGILGGIFLLVPNFTGNVIGTMASSTSNILGAVLLVAGLVGSFFWMKSKDKK
jgi:hypothetical protein